ncbi:DUF2480 family protein [uncultured Maribacter sp.]|uniref:DUF2480 family protein n=1 Tax=uncultured Maribacter sp. TaxID=431308 RepID=UPI002616E288|nr:DUF2480 family protein [uncultured Maribacter sp.]
MEGEIRNKVAESQLMTFNLEDYYPEGKRMILDISEWLYEGFILKEKDFRNSIKEHNWEQYKDAYVAVNCSTDAIIPGWAYMLIATKLEPFVAMVIQGNLDELNTLLYRLMIEDLDVSAYKDKPVIIKGCSNKPVPSNAYVWATIKLQNVAKSIMYGEACSSVPLYKKK